MPGINIGSGSVGLGAVTRTGKASYYMRADGTAGSFAAATSPDAAATSISATFLEANAGSLNPGDTIYISDQGGVYNTAIDDGTGIDGYLIFPSDCLNINFRPAPGESPVIGDGVERASTYCVKHNSSKGNRIYSGITYNTAGVSGIRQTTCDDWYENCVMNGGSGATDDGDGVNENGGKLTFKDLTITGIQHSSATSSRSLTLHDTGAGGVIEITGTCTITDCDWICAQGTNATGKIIINNLVASGMVRGGIDNAPSSGSPTVIVRGGTITNSNNVTKAFTNVAGGTLSINNVTYTDTHTGGSQQTCNGDVTFTNCTITTGQSWLCTDSSGHQIMYNNTFTCTDQTTPLLETSGGGDNSTFDIQGNTFDLENYISATFVEIGLRGQTHTAVPTSNAANKLFDTVTDLSTANVGDDVYNATTGDIARVTVVDGANELTLDADIFANTSDTYRIFKPREQYRCFNGNIVKNRTVPSGSSLLVPNAPMTFSNNVFFGITTDKWIFDIHATSDMYNNIFHDCTLSAQEIERNVSPANATTRASNNYSGTTTNKVAEVIKDSSGGTVTYPDGTTAWTSTTTDFSPQTTGFDSGGIVWWNTNAVDRIIYQDSAGEVPPSDPPIGAYLA